MTMSQPFRERVKEKGKLREEQLLEKGLDVDKELKCGHWLNVRE